MDFESVFRFGSQSDKYLWADKDGHSVKQEQNCFSQNAHWTVESFGKNIIRLRSCYGKYLTASGEPFENSLTEYKVIQTNRDDLTVKWEMIESGKNQVMLRSVGCQFQYLTANKSSIPQRNNSVTHMELGSGIVWWEREFVEKKPMAHAAVQGFTASQSVPTQTSRATHPSQAEGNVSTWLAGASNVASLAFTGYKFLKEIQKEEPPTHKEGAPTLNEGPPTLNEGPPTLNEGPPITPDDSGDSVFGAIGEIVSGLFG